MSPLCRSNDSRVISFADALIVCRDVRRRFVSRRVRGGSGRFVAANAGRRKPRADCVDSLGAQQCSSWIHKLRRGTFVSGALFSSVGIGGLEQNLAGPCTMQRA